MKQTGTKKRKNSILLRLAIVVFCTYAVVSLIKLQYELVSSRQKLAVLDVQLEEQKNDNEEMQRLLDSEDQTKITERAVRDKLDYVYEDEQVFTDISGKTGR